MQTKDMSNINFEPLSSHIVSHFYCECGYRVEKYDVFSLNVVVRIAIHGTGEPFVSNGYKAMRPVTLLWECGCRIRRGLCVSGQEQAPMFSLWIVVFSMQEDGNIERQFVLLP